MQKKYQIHKFGGSSLADQMRFMAVKSILSGKDEVIVASAIFNTTKKLQTILDHALAFKPYRGALSALEKKHLAIAQALLPVSEVNIIKDMFKQDIKTIQALLQATQYIGVSLKETSELILGYGERWSSQILAAYLNQFANVLYLDASTIIFTYEKNGMSFIDWQKSEAALHAFLNKHTFDQLVITGFIASTVEGRRTTLGRNGSDFSAAIIAKLMKAAALTIWTDVDGIYTADPKCVRSAFVIDSLSYKEAMELAYFGAKVLHPKTIAPLLSAEIPLYIKNSYRPEQKGTFISTESVNSHHSPIKGISVLDEMALINIEGSGMMGVSGTAARVFAILKAANISVNFISQASSEHSICFALANQAASFAHQHLLEKLKFDLSEQQIENISIVYDCAIVAVVGDGMIGCVGIANQLCASLAKANISIRAISQGSSERNISLVLDKQNVSRALQVIHAGFYLSGKTISIGLIGPGQVGATLLQQIKVAKTHLSANYQVNLSVRGIMSSQKMLLKQEAIDLENWQEALHVGVATDLKQFMDHIISDDVPHAVIIDCTANKEIAIQYDKFIEQGIHVITPNKHANSGDLAYYKKLKAKAKKNNHYLYEATVCAGLPVMTTLQDIIKTGDKVLKIEGIVSGTLSFIFNELAKGRLFSEVVNEAKSLGYTEPDPRCDLSGMDVARKLVCLAREIGHDISLSQVSVHNLVPEALKEVSLSQFLSDLKNQDAEMAAYVEKALANKERLAYVGSIDEAGRVKVAIESFPLTHPFASLKRTDNMLVFHTQRYHQQPLVIQGPGAGKEVTAAGIFADLLRLVSFLS